MSRFLSFIKIAGYWLGSFFLAKGLFLIINSSDTASLSVGTLLLVLFHSLRMDVSAAAYLLLLPLVLFAISEWTSRRRWLRIGLWGYTLVMQLLVLSATLFDAFAYRHWGYRMDISPVLLYAQTPGAAMASITWLEIIGFWVLFLMGIFAAMRASRFFLNSLPTEPRPIFSLAWLVSAAALIIPIRGGLQQIPINPGVGYFSNQAFANHATVNTLWNLGYSYTKWGKADGKNYRFFDADKADFWWNAIQAERDTVAFSQLIRRDSPPNVLLLIVESLTAGVVPSLGGERVALGVDSLARQGVLFNHFYANGDRSEEGVIAILSGFPPLPGSSPAAFPDRLHRLPSLMQDFKQQGYQTAFYSGAEGSFANIGAYLQSQSIDEIIEKKDFPTAQITTKWGVHDHLVFDYVYRALEQKNSPFFAIVETLSSHEPFDVPPPQRFAGSSEADLFRNAIAYTDRSLADFIQQLEKSPLWSNLWVIIVADHGHRLPAHHDANNPSRFHIPMIWLGGAVERRDTVIGEYLAQTDIPVLVGQQLGWNTDASYVFGKGMAQRRSDHAFYTFQNGFGLVTPKGACIYDHNARKNVWLDASFEQGDSLGMGYLQRVEREMASWLKGGK